MPGNNIKSILKRKQPGYAMYKESTDGSFFILAFRESQFISITAHSYGDHRRCTRERKRYASKSKKDVITLKYPQVLDDYYAARHCVDDNNHTRMAIAPLEQSTLSPDIITTSTPSLHRLLPHLPPSIVPFLQPHLLPFLTRSQARRHHEIYRACLFP